MMTELLLGQKGTWNESITLLRVWVGVIFLYHGLSIWRPEGMTNFTNYLTSLNIPFPTLSAYLCRYSEFFGGIFLILGFLFRPSCIFLIIDMTVATFIAGKGELFQGGMTTFILLICCLTLLFSPGGKLSIDWLIINRMHKSSL